MALQIQREQKENDISFAFAQQLDKPTLVIFYCGKGEPAKINPRTDFELYCKKLGLRSFVVSIFSACMNSNHHLPHGLDIKQKICNEAGISKGAYKLPQCIVMDNHGLFEHIDFNVACYQHTLFDDKMPSFLQHTSFGKCQINWKPEDKNAKIKRIQQIAYPNNTQTIMDNVKIDFGKVVIPINIQNKPNNVETEAICIDMNHSCCHGEPMNLTPFIRASVAETNVQSEEWDVAAGVEEFDLY
eukprot:213580_1